MSISAERLLRAGGARPPVPQVVVTLGSRASQPLRASNEETLAAAYDGGGASVGTASRREAQLAMLAGAVAMRTLGQAAPWFPGDGGPDAGDLAEEFGVASVSFASGVPAAWHPYYLRELETGLGDLQTVLPYLSFNGLHIHFVAGPLRDSALALHDPRSRTLELPVATAGGTLAHELSHDLDWQAARRLYADGTGYSTDRAMRDRRGALASSLRIMADARPQRPYGAALPDRPAELFARGADWLVTSVLAQRGRSNGFLSAIEDGVLSGYAAGSPAMLGAAGTASILSAVEEMTYLPDSVRRGVEAQWSDPRAIDPVLLVRRVLEASVSWRGVPMRPDGSAASALAALPARFCVTGSDAGLRARESLLNLAIDARARGSSLRRARIRPGSWRPGVAASLLGAAPSSPDAGDRVVEGLRAAIVSELGSSVADQGVVPAAPAIFRSSASSCSIIAR